VLPKQSKEGYTRSSSLSSYLASKFRSSRHAPETSRLHSCGGALRSSLQRSVSPFALRVILTDGPCLDTSEGFSSVSSAGSVHLVEQRFGGGTAPWALAGEQSRRCPLCLSINLSTASLPTSFKLRRNVYGIGIAVSEPLPGPKI
jgi:hypothetical protein